jgi:hypothetical protein
VIRRRAGSPSLRTIASVSPHSISSPCRP